MTIHFWSIGESHDVHIKQGVEDFTQRISRYYKVKWNIIQPPKNAGLMSEIELRRKEGENILESLGKDDYLVALDERGIQVSSEKLAEILQARANDSTKNLVFLAGG